MTTRSRQAKMLAQLLGERINRPGRVRLAYDGPRTSDGHYGGWVVEWTHGPTHERMKALASALAKQTPAVPVEQLRYDRSNTDLATIIAVLLWFDDEPNRATAYSPVFIPNRAFDAIDDPDLADEHWRQRGAALQRLGSAAVQILVQHVHRQGWDATKTWLDTCADDGRHLRVVR